MLLKNLEHIIKCYTFAAAKSKRKEMQSKNKRLSGTMINDTGGRT